jgi:acyl dehydratase
VTVYAYLTHPLVEAYGAAWLERGTASVRFLKPIHDGEEVRVVGAVTLPAGAPVSVNLALYPAAPLPGERPLATREHWASLDALGTPVNPYDEARAAEYLERVSDTLALYRGARGWAHPGFFLDQANKALSQNARMSPWIHVGSVVRHLGGARVGETLATRGRVRSLFEKKGRQFVEADLAIVAETGARPRPVVHVLHTAIYCLTSAR